MSERPATVVAVVALMIVSGTLGFAGVGAVSASSATQAADSYVVEQGDACQPIEPISTSRTVESFYDYRNHETHPDSEPEERQYSSYGTAHLQEDDTSHLMLHEGTDGVSLVIVHDRLDSETDGGVATFDIVGLPGESEWVVQDDLYDGESNMVEWYEDDNHFGASWIWAEGRTDGGAIRGGLNDEFSLTIHPAFNEDAELYGAEDIYDPDYAGDGEITDWHVLSGSFEDPDRIELSSLDEPVTIRTGTCDDPTVTYDRTNGETVAHVTDAAADDPILLQPSMETDDGVRFEKIELTGLDGEASFGFESDRPDGLPDSPDDADALGALTVTGDSTDYPATVTISVDADLLEERDAAAEEIALYEVNGTEWNETETTIRNDAGDAHLFTAEVSSLDGFVVGHQEPEPDERSYTSPTPGFTAGAAVAAAFVLALLWAVRRRG
ncbi:hypothetical protein [Natrarchaeobius oligotrophus]|uniref:PGF-CTERM sorting domain-containing protein n=1 Tax=Natrarchaeobius chitinivorans TaxID=1679083 RepID=A0A3N6MGK3_NATCH|nr:hypothetical protein [Natrarchaeobius chitinivorans]RQH03194.1 hypothetical protein EA472_00980 [Natrarchaeobius chitinivorans]